MAGLLLLGAPGTGVRTTISRVYMLQILYVNFIEASHVYEVDIAPTLQVRKLSLREGETLAQGHRAKK